MTRHLPVGLCVSLVFCALIFAILLFSSKPPAESVDSLQSEASAESYIPGGIQLSRGGDQTTLVSETVFSDRPQTSDEPVALGEIHVRGRALRLSEQIKLQPPPLGREDEAMREFVFDLFDDVQLIGQIERLERHDDDRAVYYGALSNVRGGDFILAYNQGHIAATFNTPGMGSYQIRPRGDGTVAAYELDLSRLPACNAQMPVSDAVSSPEIVSAEIRAKAALHQLYAAADPVEGAVYNGTGQQGGDGEGLTFTTMDVLIVHTANATAAAGGPEAMGAIIDLTFARANSALINSEVGLRLRMVRSEQVTYNEIDRETSLDDITDGTGSFSNVPTWRNQSGADLVALIFHGDGGLAWIYNGNPDFGYSVNGLSAIESTFIHEVGHNLGCLHDRDNNDLTIVYPFGHGWEFTPEGSGLLGTIMSVGSGSRIPYFSNPDVTYMGTATGVPIGEPLQSNNAELIRQTKALVANFRAENGNVPPTVSLDSPGYSDPFKALDSVNLAATASDSDGTVQDVRFYRLMSDADFNFSGKFSTSLGSDDTAPYAGTESAAPAGFWTYAAVARDDDGSIGVDTVSVTVAPHYRRTNLPLPTGKLRASLEGINEAGRLVGFGYDEETIETDTQAAYWENGAMTLLNPLAGHTGAKALAVGQDGGIYGESINSAGTRRAVKWDGSTTPSDISDLIGGFTAESALGVDEQDRIYLADDQNVPSYTNEYRRYNNPGSTTASNNVFWEKVSNTGTFATGRDYDSGPAAWRALRWSDTGTLLPPVSGFVSSWGFATNRSGAVFGLSSPQALGWSSSTARLTFWAADSTTPVDLGTLGVAGGTAHGLNDWNEAVGSANNSEDGQVAVIWKGQGSLLKLSDVVLPQSGLKRDARVINNRGQIAGTGFDESDQFIYFLDPLPGLDNRYWLANHFTPAELEDETLTDDSANPAGDGISNLAKRAYGIDPRIVASAVEREKLPEAGIDEDGHYQFTFRRLRAPRDIDYLPELSLTLEAASWDDSLLEEVGSTFIDDDFEEVQLRTTFPLSEEDRAFIRLRLER